MAGDFIQTELVGGVATLRIVRPEARNALDRTMFEDMRAALAGWAADPAVRALVITGADGAFCAGADLSDPMMGRGLPPDQAAETCKAVLGGLMNGLIRDIRAAPFPVLAAVNGVAAGGGVGLALAADLVIAAQGARFMQPFVPHLGLVPDLGATWHNARLLGRARALGVTLLGEALDAQQAADWGLIWRAVPEDDFAAEVAAIAARLAAGSRGAQLATRALIDRALTHDFDSQLDAERDAQAVRVTTRDVAEAMAAFAEKRPPDFGGKGD